MKLISDRIFLCSTNLRKCSVVMRFSFWIQRLAIGLSISSEYLHKIFDHINYCWYFQYAYELDYNQSVLTQVYLQWICRIQINIVCRFRIRVHHQWQECYDCYHASHWPFFFLHSDWWISLLYFFRVSNMIQYHSIVIIFA